jgi:hypothetical protein
MDIPVSLSFDGTSASWCDYLLREPCPFGAIIF